jgi:ABC-type Fe3+/spermidine/putrescine transport system ATPase subunit
LTHGREEAFSLAMRIIVMEQGQIKLEGGINAISKYFQNSENISKNLRIFILY